jgi:hypothetical protein
VLIACVLLSDRQQDTLLASGVMLADKELLVDDQQL